MHSWESIGHGVKGAEPCAAYTYAQEFLSSLIVSGPRVICFIKSFRQLVFNPNGRPFFFSSINLKEYLWRKWNIRNKWFLKNLFTLMGDGPFSDDVAKGKRCYRVARLERYGRRGNKDTVHHDSESERANPADRSINLRRRISAASPPHHARRATPGHAGPRRATPATVNADATCAYTWSDPLEIYLSPLYGEW